MRAFSYEMSEAAQGAQRRGTSDFSIERILSKNVPPSSATSSSTTLPRSVVGPGQTVYPLSGSGLQNQLEWFKSFCKLQLPTESRHSGDAVKPETVTIDKCGDFLVNHSVHFFNN